MKKIVNIITFVLFIIFVLCFIAVIVLSVKFFKLIGNSEASIGEYEIIKDIMIPLITTLTATIIPVIVNSYFENKTHNEDLQRSLEMLERHRKEDKEGFDCTRMPGYAIEYGFIVNNWNKCTKKILKLAKEDSHLQRKTEGPEQWVKNHFLGKKFN